jgi:hypothetical protein
MCRLIESGIENSVWHEARIITLQWAYLSYADVFIYLFIVLHPITFEQDSFGSVCIHILLDLSSV